LEYDCSGEIMDAKTVRRIHRVTVLVLFAAIAFYLFFQVNKSEPFREVNPFGEDPYDAVGSFAIQGAILIGMLTYARALRFYFDLAQAPKARLILRGNLLVMVAIWVTLIADLVAEMVRVYQSSYWGNVIRVDLGLMFVLATICLVALAVVFRRIPIVSPPVDLTPADGIDDLWTLVRVPVRLAKKFLPRRLVGWVEHFSSDRLFTRASWVNPRTHPWRFAVALGLLVGIGLVAAQLQEGYLPA